MKTVYLDSRDLIRLVAKELPLPPTEFAAILVSKSWQLAFSFSNICEVVVVQELLETRRRLQVLQSMPHVNILAMPAVRCLEFAAAVSAFECGQEPASVVPFVSRWHQTYTVPGQRDYQDMLVNYSLVDQVLPLAMLNSNVGHNVPWRARQLQEAVDRDRAVTDAVRRNHERFANALKRDLGECGIPAPSAGVATFAKWLRANGSRCPGWQLFDEAYLEFCTNVQDTVDRGDISDWAHIATLPYVEALTLDRRMANYCRTAATRLAQRGGRDHAERIYANTEAWLLST
ncbi:MAG: hypothetical protein ABI779_05735 [Acidobacteriota bacterium]